jgi:hypothetical protein
MVVVAFQITFHAEMYQNDVFFYFFKIIFEISMSKRFKTYKSFLETWFAPRSQTLGKCVVGNIL